ncbi:MAG: hypothetical protein Q9162_007513 [Coniocarpon cinnabarinum]
MSTFSSGLPSIPSKQTPTISGSLQDDQAFHLPPEQFVPAFHDFIKTTAPIPTASSPPPPPTQNSTSRVSHVSALNRSSVSQNAVDICPRQSGNSRSSRTFSGISVDSTLVENLSLGEHKPSLVRSQTYPPRKPSMASEQDVLTGRVRHQPVVSIYDLKSFLRSVEPPLPSRESLPAANEYLSEDFSPTAAVFDCSSEESIFETKGLCIPAGECHTKLPEPLLPHEHIARYQQKQRDEALASPQGFDSNEWADGSSGNVSPHTRMPVRGPTSSEQVVYPSNFYGRSNVNISDDDSHSNYSVRHQLSDVEARLQMSFSTSPSSPFQRSYDDADGFPLSTKEHSPDSVVSEVLSFEDQLENKFGDMDLRSSVTSAHDVYKRESLRNRIKSMHFKASTQNSDEVYALDSPIGTCSSKATSNAWSARPSLHSTNTSVTAYSPQSAVSPWMKHAPRDTTSNLLDSASAPATPAEGEGPANKATGRRKFLLRHSKSILKPRRKDVNSKKESPATSPLTSPKSAKSNSTKSPDAPMLGYPRPMSVAKPVRLWDKHGAPQISKPVQGSLTSGVPLEQNPKTWMQRREEAKKAKQTKQRENMKSSIRVVGMGVLN